MIFSDLSQAVFAAHGRGEYAVALDLIDENAASVAAHHRPRLVFWRACILSLLARPEDALAALVDALGQGVWWDPSMLDSDADLEAVRRLPAWSVYRDRLVEHRDTVIATTGPRLIVERPAHPVREPCPAVLVLHGAGGSAAEIQRDWLAVLESGWVLAAAQSSRPTGTASFAWDDHGRAIAELRAHVESLRSSGLDVGSSVLGGFSQGGGIAMAAVLSGEVPTRRFLVQAPAFRVLPSHIHELVTRPDASTVEGVIVVGSEDHGHEEVARAASRLSGMIGQCTMEVVRGVGHESPPDFPDRLRRWLTRWHAPVL